METLENISRMSPQELEEFLLKRQYEKSITRVMKGKRLMPFHDVSPPFSIGANEVIKIH